MSTVSDFINQNLGLANGVSLQTGIPTVNILGQWGLETGWGSSFAGANNYGNVSPGGSVASYTTPQAGANAYANTISKYNVNTSSASAFANSVASGGYATDPNYASKLTGAIMTASNAMPSSGSNAWDSVAPLPGNLYLSTPAYQPMATTMQGLYNQVSNTSPGQSAGGKAAVSSTSWIQTNLGNYGLVFFGAILVVGALLISQKSIVETVAKGA